MTRSPILSIAFLATLVLSSPVRSMASVSVFPDVGLTFGNGNRSGLDFGSQLVGSTSEGRTVEIVFTDPDKPSEFLGASIVGLDAPYFGQTAYICAPFPAGSVCSFEVFFSPSSSTDSLFGTNSFHASLNVALMDPGAVTVSYALTGTALAPADTLPTRRVGTIAQVAFGGGWTTNITITNVSGYPVQAAIYLYSDSGTQLQAPTPATLGAFASYTMTLGPSGAVSTAWADVQSQGPLVGFAAYREADSDFEVTVPMDNSVYATSLIMPFDNTNGYQTGIAIAEDWDPPAGCGFDVCPVSYEMVFYDETGSRIAVTAPQLPMHGHISMFLTDIMAAVAGRRGFVQISGLGYNADPPGSNAITATGLRFSPSGSFTSIPIVRP